MNHSVPFQSVSDACDNICRRFLKLEIVPRGTARTPALRRVIQRGYCWLGLLCGVLLSVAHAETPPLLAKAMVQWTSGEGELAFTQQSQVFHDDGRVKEERIERYDPSLPDRSRWQLIEVDGQTATSEQREKWETWKNGRPRKKAMKSPSDYLDLEHATLLDESPTQARFEMSFLPATARLLAVEKIAIVITVDQASGSIVRISATLRQPIRVLLGLARITDLDLDVRVERTDDDTNPKSGAVIAGSMAHVTLSKLGTPMEYRWSDFRRVSAYRAP